MEVSLKSANSFAPFAQLCGATLEKGGAGSFLVGIKPTSPIVPVGSSRLWAFDVYSDDCGAPDDGVQFDVSEVVSDLNADAVRSTEVVATAYGSPPILTDLRLACFRDVLPRPDWAKLRVGKQAPKRQVLNLTVRDEQVESLDLATKALLEEAALYSIAAWSRACMWCRPETLSLVRVNDRIFAPSLIIELLNSTVESASLTGGSIISPTPFARTLEGLWDRFFKIRDQQVPAFLPLTASDERLLCDGPFRASLLDADFKCEDGKVLPFNESANLKISLVHGYTECGDDPEIIACERNGKDIQLNVRDYSFAKDGKTAIAFGSGKRVVSLDIVVAHELGHWLGLGHVDVPGALMAPTVKGTNCIDTADVNAIRSANELGRPHGPATTALRYR